MGDFVLTLQVQVENFVLASNTTVWNGQNFMLGLQFEVDFGPWRNSGPSQGAH